jgi:hypothetical protein
MILDKVFDRVRKYFRYLFPPAGSFIDRRENLARINGTAPLKKPPVEYGRCNVPVDSPKVPKSTSRRFEMKQQMRLLRSLYE